MNRFANFEAVLIFLNRLLLKKIRYKFISIVQKIILQNLIIVIKIYSI